MSDTDELDLDGDIPGGKAASKRASGFTALLPNLLKFVAIGLGAVVFIVTVSVITFNILNRGGRAQTVIPSAAPFVGARPQFQFFTGIGVVRTTTNDPLPFSVVVDLVIGFDLGDNAAHAELSARQFELRDFVRVYFRSRTADELRPENEPRLRQEILEQLNTRILNTARARVILFNQLDVMSMY